MSEQKYPVGVQSFSEIREGNYVYVDKTDLVFRLVDRGKYYFLSRPRRFGKSLLLSTIEAYFLGRRDLFKGLAIDSLTDSWDAHPVLHLDLGPESYKMPGSLESMLSNILSRWERLYGMEPTEMSFSQRFMGVILRAQELTGKKVVVLVDEYDKPLLDTLGEENRSQHDLYRDILRGFYGCLKSSDPVLKFVMLSGVTKFSQVSIFSGLNNLNDISLDRMYSTICGITPDELDRRLRQGIVDLAAASGKTYGETVALLKESYDGYHFASDLRDVYNPFSLMSAFSKLQTGNYWYQSGNPSFLIRMLLDNGLDLESLQRQEESPNRLQDLDLASRNPVPLLFQTGYLTIKGYDPEFDEYILGYPNREVKQSFLDSLVPQYVGRTDGAGSAFDVKRFVREVRQGDADSFMRRFQALFAGFPYEQIRDCELHYHNVIYLTFTLMGFYVSTEYRISDGRCDAVVKTDRFIYVFEFKFGRTAQEALDQIDLKRYDLPFSADGRKLFRIGVNFSPKTRRIDDIIIR